MNKAPKQRRTAARVGAEARAGADAIASDDEKAEGEPEYGSQEYWDRRYANPETANHEWYFGYDTLQPLVHELLPSRLSEQWSALEIGCGDRPLLPDLAADPHFAGCRAICFDYAPTVVRALRHAAREALRNDPALAVISYEQADARSLVYPNESFDIVIDKGEVLTEIWTGLLSLALTRLLLAGTIDAMMCSDTHGVNNARQICGEAARVVSPGGLVAVVSHMSPTGDEGSVFLSQALLPALSARSAAWLWDVGVHFDESAEETGPFVYAVRKTRRRATRAALGQNHAPEIRVRLHAY